MGQSLGQGALGPIDSGGFGMNACSLCTKSESRVSALKQEKGLDKISAQYCLVTGKRLTLHHYNNKQLILLILILLSMASPQLPPPSPRSQEALLDCFTQKGRPSQGRAREPVESQRGRLCSDSLLWASVSPSIQPPPRSGLRCLWDSGGRLLVEPQRAMGRAS